MSDEKSKKFSIKNVIIGVVVVVAVLIALYVPARAKGKAKAACIDCASNMKQIHMAIQLFAEDNGDQIPASINDLVANDLLDKKALCCPCDSQKTGYALLLTPGSKLAAIQSPETPIIVCKCHEGTEIVLCADGNVKQNK